MINIALSFALVVGVITLVPQLNPLLLFVGSGGSSTSMEVVYLLIILITTFSLIVGALNYLRHNRSTAVYVTIFLSFILLLYYSVNIIPPIIQQQVSSAENKKLLERREQDEKNSVIENKKNSEIFTFTWIIDDLKLDPTIYDFTNSHRNPTSNIITADYQTRVTIWREFFKSHTVIPRSGDTVVYGQDSAGNKTTEIFLTAANNTTNSYIPFSVLKTSVEGREYLEDIVIGKLQP